MSATGDLVTDGPAEETRPAERRAAVTLQGIERRFGDVVAVDGVDLEILDNEFFSLIGPSGCGKTTTLRIIAGLQSPTAGRVLLHGRDVTDVPAYRRPVNTVFQHYALFPHLNVFENVAFGLRERRVGREETRRRVSEMLALVQLAGRERAKPKELSGGQQQRVALARALILQPEVLLLDEPLGALDLKLRRQMQTLLKQVQREVGITFVYVTHDQEEAFSMSDRVGIMNGGVLEQLGDPRAVYRSPRTLFVADFVGASNRFPAVVKEAVSASALRVEIERIASVEVAGVETLRAGDEAMAIVRPEAIQLNPVGECAIRVDGRISEVAYLGPQTVCAVEVEGLGQLNVLVGNEEQPELVPGSPCVLGWSPGAMWLVSR